MSPLTIFKQSHYFFTNRYGQRVDDVTGVLRE